MSPVTRGFLIGFFGSLLLIVLFELMQAYRSAAKENKRLMKEYGLMTMPGSSSIYIPGDNKRLRRSHEHSQRLRESIERLEKESP